MPSNPKILIVEDEAAQLELLNYNLNAEGFEINSTQSGDEGLLLAQESQPDLIILDWMLPGMTGIEVCRALKSKKNTKQIPIIMLTARTEEGDRVKGLETGADDYVVKPYSMVELIARIRALLRRTRPSTIGEILSYGDILLDAEQHKVSRSGKSIKMGPTEFKLLATFMEKPGRVWSRDQLLDRVWGMDADIDDRTVDVHVGRLRKLLSQNGEPDPIRTVRGTGYSLDSDG